MAKSVLGFVGGSGLYDLAVFENPRWERVASPWGVPSDDILFAEVDGLPVRFLPRHGRGHRIPPSEINYRANIDALKIYEVAKYTSLTYHNYGPTNVVINLEIWNGLTEAQRKLLLDVGREAQSKTRNLIESVDNEYSRFTQPRAVLPVAGRHLDRDGLDPCAVFLGGVLGHDPRDPVPPAVPLAEQSVQKPAQPRCAGHAVDRHRHRHPAGPAAGQCLSARDRLRV